MGVPVLAALGPVLLGLLVFMVAVIITGRYVCDGRAAMLWSMLGVWIVTVVLVPSGLLWIGRGSVVGRWIIIPLVLGVAGVTTSLTTTIGPGLFPAGVRASGFNISRSIDVSIYGGACTGIICLVLLKKSWDWPCSASSSSIINHIILPRRCCSP